MTNKSKIEQLMSVLIGLSAFMMVTGALFRLQHYPYGNEIFSAGSLLYIFSTVIEIRRLRKAIRRSRLPEGEA